MHDTELSYANPDHPWLKRWVIRAIETLSGRSYLPGYYRYWRDAVAATSAHKWTDLLSLVGVNVVVAQGSWPPQAVPDGPLVMIANHPYGLSDGLAVLSLAERLDRPYRILINNEHRGRPFGKRLTLLGFQLPQLPLMQILLDVELDPKVVVG